jgi:hypothetical protein
MTDSIIINILLIIFLIVISVIVFYILSLCIMLIISNCSAYIYEQFKKCSDSCDTFFKQEEYCAHCDQCCKSSVLSIHHTNEIINEECAICITDNNSNSISLNCNHTYHSKCIGPWIKQCNQIEQIPQCPLCKADIV